MGKKLVHSIRIRPQIINREEVLKDLWGCDLNINNNQILSIINT
jgi:hypothetical protein